MQETEVWSNVRTEVWSNEVWSNEVWSNAKNRGVV